MSDLGKVGLIQNLCSDHGITAYEIAKHTGYSATGVQKLLDGKTKRPRRETLDRILEFLESAIVGVRLEKDQKTKGSTTESFRTITLDDGLIKDKMRVAMLISWIIENQDDLEQNHEIFRIFLQSVLQKNENQKQGRQIASMMKKRGSEEE